MLAASEENEIPIMLLSSSLHALQAYHDSF